MAPTLLAKAQLPWFPGWAGHQNLHPFPMHVLPRDCGSFCQIDVGCVGARADPHTPVANTGTQPGSQHGLIRTGSHCPGCCPYSLCIPFFHIARLKTDCRGSWDPSGRRSQPGKGGQHSSFIYTHNGHFWRCLQHWMA